MDSKTLLKLLELLDGNPEDTKKEMQELFNSARPLVLAVYDGLIGIMDDISNDKRFAEIYARLLKNKFDALVEAGFTEPQSMQILLNTQYNISDLVSKNK